MKYDKGLDVGGWGDVLVNVEGCIEVDDGVDDGLHVGCGFGFNLEDGS